MLSSIFLSLTEGLSAEILFLVVIEVFEIEGARTGLDFVEVKTSFLVVVFLTVAGALTVSCIVCTYVGVVLFCADRLRFAYILAIWVLAAKLALDSLVTILESLL